MFNDNHNVVDGVNLIVKTFWLAFAVFMGGLLILLVAAGRDWGYLVAGALFVLLIMLIVQLGREREHINIREDKREEARLVRAIAEANRIDAEAERIRIGHIVEVVPRQLPAAGETGAEAVESEARWVDTSSGTNRHAYRPVDLAQPRPRVGGGPAGETVRVFARCLRAGMHPTRATCAGAGVSAAEHNAAKTMLTSAGFVSPSPQGDATEWTPDALSLAVVNADALDAWADKIEKVTV